MTITESTTDTPAQIAAVLAAPVEPAAENAAEPAAELAEAAKEQEEGGAEPEAEKEKRKGGFQRRIDQLSADKRELEARLAAAEKTKVDPPPFAEKPVLANFEEYEAYTEALVGWKVEQREAAKSASAEVAKQAEQTASLAGEWGQRQEAARAAYEDYDAVVGRDDIPVTAAMKQTILESERGADLAYWLGKNPDEAKRIAGLGPVAAIRALGKVEDSLPDPQAKPKLKLSTAPEPIKPVGGGKTTFTKNPADMDFQEFRAWREKGGGR